MIIYKGSPIRLLVNFSTETLQARKIWHDIFKWWKERTYHQEYSTHQESQISLLFKLIYFNWRLITLQYCGGFCHTLTWIRHGCTWVPNPESPSHLTPHIISLDHPCAPASSILYPVSNIDWRFISYMIVYMFQCHSPKSSHSLPWRF